MPIRWRLTLWFSLVLGGILALSGFFTHTLLRGYLNSEIDDSLRAYSASAHGTLVTHQAEEPLDFSVIHSGLPAISEFFSPGMYIQIISKDGAVLDKSDNLGAQELPVDPVLIQRALGGQIDLETLAAGDGATVRVMATPMYFTDRTLILEVGRSLRTLDLTMNRAMWALLGGVFASLLLASLLGYGVIRGSLLRVQQVTRTAREIEESSDLGRKVNYRGPADEIQELSTTFDRMIARLDAAFRSQKQFIADASHELRTPLTVIKGNIALLKRKMPEPERGECVQEIQTEAERMARTVNDLLVLAELEGGQAGEQGRVSLAGVLMENLTRAQHLGDKKKIELGRHDDLFVNGDVHRLNQMVGNLVDNAVKYTPDGGTITLSLSQDGDCARIEVEDTGVGMAPEHLQQIFERFYRVDKARSRAVGGTGLGLAIVRQIAESFGGRVTVSSVPGKGSIFTVWLKL